MSVGVKRWLLGALALLAFECTTLKAHAEVSSPAPLASGWSAGDSQGAPAQVWYGAPILLMDIASLGAFLGGTAAADHGYAVGGGLMIVGAGTYLLGGPIVHLTERGTRAGFASLGLRAGLPVGGALVGAIVGAVVGSKASCGANETCGLGGMAIGFVLGFLGGGVAAIAVDNGVLAYKSPTPRWPALALTPVYHPATRHTGLALRVAW
jgi:hypothetical protein